MLTELRVTRKGAQIYQGKHEIADAQSFARACSAAWNEIDAARIKSATSVGALFDDLENINPLDGIVMTWRSARD